MWKLVFFVAFVANIVLIVSSADSSSGSSSSSSSSASSSSSSSSGSSSSHSGENTGGSDDNCDDDSSGSDDNCDDDELKCGPNETCVECPSATCGAKTCSELGYPQPCPIQVDDATCPVKPACLCVEGYLRNNKGICVPENQCPSCGGDPNAQAGCGINCGRLCSNYNSEPTFCPAICKLNGCDCKPDYVFDSNIGKCVLPKDCTPVCEPNEVYSSCSNGGCYSARKCCDIGNPMICVDPRECEKGCLCADGYLRSDNGTCVPVNDCPNTPQCGPNETYDLCPATCPPQECGVDQSVILCPRNPKISDPTCEAGCRCIDGYVRNDDGDCITKDQCPEKECTKPNEEYVSCPVTCPPQTCESIGKVYHCPLNKPANKTNCNGACRCKLGYYRNSIGDCITEENCVKCSGPNEFYSCGGACDNVCATLCEQNQTSCPIVNIKCNEMCYCEEGNARDENNICVPFAECTEPVSCKGDPNAQPGCGINCNRLCSNYKYPGTVGCAQVCYEDGCDCKKGYVLDTNTGKCVLPEECTPECTTNEVYSSCSNGGCYSARKCCEIGNPTVCVDPVECKGGCLCADGYLRNDNGTCIPVGECPNAPTCDDQNEKFDLCPDLCPPQQCDVDPNLVDCAPNPEVGDPRCKPGCRCEDGYARNDCGVCVPRDQCQSCKGDPNAKPGCGVNCGRLCSNYKHSDNIACIDICYVDGCDCKEGFVLDENTGKCVLPEQCTLQCTKPNEEYVNCTYSCPPDTCESIGKSYSCPAQTETNCHGACKCVSDFYRNAIGDCISEENCKKCSGPNEYYSCGGACDNVCSTLSQQNQTNCPIINVKCNEMCYCKEGYARDANNVCVLICDCPSPTCGDNEVFSDCVNGGCFGARNCTEKGRQTICIDLVEGACRAGCICKENYLRNDDGICVPQDQCPSTCTCNNPNEVYDECPITCPPQTCGVDPKLIKCKAGPQPGDPECKPGCRCADGYLRNKIDICVKKEECESCKGDPNAKPGCGVNCGRLCSNYKHSDNIACIDICYVDGCDCKEGFVLDENTGKCVLPEQCTLQCTKPNEEYVNCTYSCPPDTCESIGKSYSCPAQTETNCHGACKCVSDFYRNAIGDCISEENCKKCSGPNEYYSCGGACDNVCSTLSQQNQTNCPIINVKCNEMCYCKEGYARDANNVCVLICDCPSSTCGFNEEYSSCTQSICRHQNCTEKDQSVKCIRIDPKYCKRGCVCKEDYLRDQNGICVPEDQCDNVKCPDGEIYNKCPATKCDAEYCPLSRDSPTACKSTKNCGPPRCTCGFNQKRDRKTKKCIATSNCPPFECNGPNEEYKSCPPWCPGEKCSDYLNNATCPKYGRIGIVVPCTPQCRCKENYYRNSKGICIEACECQKDTCTTTPPPVTKTPKSPCKDNGDDTHDDTNVAEAQERYIKGLNIFNIDFFEEMLKINSGSFIFSTFSLGVPLGELFLYCSGESLEQLKNIMNLDTKDEVREVFKRLQISIQSHDSIEFDMAAKVYVNQNYPLSKDFLDDTKNVFNASAENVDCTNPKQAAATINQWVEDNTNQKIKNLVSSDAISLDTRIMLLNAIYFKGDWLYQFNPNDTEKMDFHVDKDTTVQVDTMYQKGKFNYAEIEDLNAKVLQLPYVNEDYTFVAFLPNEINGLQALVNTLQDTQIYNDALNKLTNQTVKIWLPSFEINTDINLADVLQKLGVTLLFDPAKSGLNGILETYEPLYITAAVQKAYIKVNEQGSEAAAANAIVAGTTSATTHPPVIPEFKADHPFLFCILYKDIATFCGAYRKDE